MNVAPKLPWWHVRRDPLLALLGERDCAYVYDLPTVRSQAAVLREMHSVSRVLYALKANPHPEILRTVHASGCGFECVSRAEIERVLESVPGIGREAVLFTVRPAIGSIRPPTTPAMITTSPAVSSRRRS